jgi:hypothetical protein
MDDVFATRLSDQRHDLLMQRLERFFVAARRLSMAHRTSHTAQNTDGEAASASSERKKFD